MAFSNAFESWRDAAQEEAKTLYIQQLRLPYKFDNLDSMLDVNPYASLLIFDSKLEKSLALNNSQGLKEKLLENLKKDLSTKAVVLKVDECLSTEDVEFEGIQCGLERTDSRVLLGLFFPNVEHRARLSVVCKSAINSRNIDLVTDVADRLADELGLNDCDSFKSTLLLFTAPFQPAAATLICELRNRVKSDQETIWVGEVGDTLAAANCYGSDQRNEQIIVAIRISGPSVESWTAYIDLRLPRNEVERKLHEMRAKATYTLKRHCTALLCAPCESAYGSSPEIMRNVKRIFPGVPFVGMFDSHEYTVSASRTHLRICKKDIYISDCSLSDAPKLGIDKYRYMSLIIITYD